MISGDLQAFFWDIDAETFDPHLYPVYTIARLLEYGDQKAISWLKQQFSEDLIKSVIRTERSLSPRSVTFWALFYKIPSEEIACLNR